MDSLTNSERVLHGSLYCLTFVSGNIVFLGFAFGGVSGLSIGRSSTALGFALASGLLAGKVRSGLTPCSGNDRAIYGLRLRLRSRHCFYLAQ